MLRLQQLRVCFALQQSQGCYWTAPLVLSASPCCSCSCKEKHVIPCKVMNHVKNCSFSRSFASDHGSGGHMKEIRYMKRYLKKEEKHVASQVLQHHLHQHNGLSLMDAEVISKNAPAFLRKLIVLSKKSKTLGLLQSDSQEHPSDSDKIRFRVERALSINRLNEWESVLESIGMAPENASEYLRSFNSGLVGGHVLLTNIKILEDFNIPRRKLGKLFESQNQTLMHFSSAQLAANIEKLQWLGVMREQVGPVVQKYPEMLKLNLAELMRPVLQLLEEVRVDRSVLGRLLMHNPQVIIENPNMLLKKVEFLVKCGMTKDYIARLLRRNPEILLSNLMDQNLMLFT
ncbi:hypothetical protein O6H91_02G098600 [Diphasiastrum complanatum]|nr:hypothetical protein O6H91_02G098600 [Diphasiastrum complanatum]